LQAQSIDWYAGLGEALRAQARYEEAINAYTEMRIVAEAHGEAVAQARAWNGLAFVLTMQGHNHDATDSAGRAEAIARGAGHEASARAELAYALFRKGWAFRHLGNTVLAKSLGEQALALSTELGELARREKASSLNLLGLIHNTLGLFKQAISHFEQALVLCQELGDRRTMASVLNNLGQTARLRGDYESAVPLYQEALTLVRETGTRESEMLSLSNLGGVFVGMGNYSEAEAETRRVIAMAGTSWFNLTNTYRVLAEACLGQGKVEDAFEAGRKALILAKETDIQDALGAAWRILGQVTAYQHKSITIDEDTYDAVDCFTESLRIYTQMGAPAEQARTLREWARYELDHGDGAYGKVLWNQAQEIFRRLDLEFELKRMTN
jgi:tetratricopeptide (TPR) repeat protein